MCSCARGNDDVATVITPRAILSQFRDRRTVRDSGRWIVISAAIVVLVSAMSTASNTPLFDPDEGYYPGTAAESVDAGTSWDPRFNGAARWDKPILTYTLIEASFAVFGRNVAAARLPVALQGVALILIVGFVVARVAGARAGAMSAVILATTLGTQVFSRVAHPELGVVMFVTVAELMAVLWVTSDRPAVRLTLTLLAGLSVGLGMLTKGPVALALPVLAVTAAGVLHGGLRMPPRAVMRHGITAVITSLVTALPWYAAMTSRHGIAFLHEAVWRHNVSRFVGTAFVHQSSPWFFVGPTLVGVFPWSAFLPIALWDVRPRSNRPQEILRLFMTVSAATAFLFYSASASRLPHYALACVPPLAILIALVVADARQRRDVQTAFRATMMLLALTGGLLAGAPFLLNRVVGAREILNALPGGSPDSQYWMFARALWPAAILLAGSVIALLVLRPQRKLRAVVAAGALLPLVLITGAQPVLAEAYPWRRFGGEVRGSDMPVYLVGPRAPSLTFYAGRPVARLSESEAQSQIWTREEGWVVASTDWLQSGHAPPAWAGRLQFVDRAGSMTLARLRRHREAGPAPELLDRRAHTGQSDTDSMRPRR